MNEKINIAMKDKLIRFVLVGSGILMVTTSSLIFILFPSLNPKIPFLNSLPWGEDRLVSSWIIFVLPAAFLFVIVVNYWISFFIYTKHVLIARILAFNALLFVFFGFLAYVQIVFLVF